MSGTPIQPGNDEPVRALDRRAVLATVVGAAGVAALAGHASAQLAPPPGPVSPTNKPISEVEPRVALTQANTPGDAGAVFVITQPGSYYLVGNVTVPANKAGVRIDATDVTLDLSGFTLTGNGAAGSTGVAAFSGDNITVRNGAVERMGDYGVAVIGEGPCRLADLTLRSNRGYGAVVGPPALLERVVAIDNAAGIVSSPAGLAIGSDTLVRECVALANRGNGFNAGANVVAQGNTADGFNVAPTSVVTGCTARSNGAAGIRAQHSAVVEASSAMDNAGVGISGSFGSCLRLCAAAGNGGGGFSAWEGSVVAACVAQFNTGDGFVLNTGCLVTGCKSSNSTTRGINANAAAGGAILACDTLGDFEGIVAGGACLVRDNRGHGHIALGSAAIRVAAVACRVEGNLCTGSGLGVHAAAARALILGNDCSGNATNWSIAANCVYGPVVNLTAAGSPAMSGNGTAPSTLGTADPFANFTV